MRLARFHVKAHVGPEAADCPIALVREGDACGCGV
jgi:dihydroxyacid dehydratase/phosphogluconate dehydratase